MNKSEHHKQAIAAISAKQYQLAHQHLVALLNEDKYFADGYFLLAMIASAYNNAVKAIGLIEQALKLAPDNTEYLAQLAKHYALENQHVKAHALAEQAVKLTPTNAITLDTLGIVYYQVGLHHKAVPLFENAIKLVNNNPHFYFNLGAALKFTGNFVAARQAYQQTIALAPKHYKAHAAISSLGSISKENNNIDRLVNLYKTIENPDDKLYIGHALAQEFEALNDIEQAFTYLEQSKRAKLNALNYNISQDQKMFAALEILFKDRSHTFTRGCTSNEPIFVVGMPRTGTTLVERIISQHQDVTSAGELQHFGLLLKIYSATASSKVAVKETEQAATNIDFNQLGEAYIASTRALTGKTKRFVDKMPLNVLYAGFIIKAFPNAKIICLDRNPLDTIVSNYRQLFSVKYSYYNYAYSLETCSQFYLLFKQLITFWQQEFPDNFYCVNYEQLVNNPVQESQTLLKFCDLSWHQDCLNIHENTAPVASASAVQIRRPINNESVGNWRKYDAYLADVKDILKTAGMDI